MITLEQAKRLKDAGWKFKVCVNLDKCIVEDGMPCPPNEFDCSMLPDEKEMMEFLKPHAIDVFVDEDDNWNVFIIVNEKQNGSYNKDLTSALVEACCKVLEKEAK